MRASDADRETVAERLRRAAGEGRILAHELEERLGRAFRAQTYGELDALVADLPRDAVVPRSRTRQLARAHPVMTTAIVLAVAFVVMAVAVVIAFVLVSVVMAWGFWLLIAALYAARRRGWHHGRYAYRRGASVGQRGRYRYRHGYWT
jgi:hypothetical protein